MINIWTLLLPLVTASPAMHTFGVLGVRQHGQPVRVHDDDKQSATAPLRRPTTAFGWVPRDTYVSRSGKMRVHLATEAGASPDGLVCTLFNDQSEAWTTRLKWPFHQAVVSDDGFVVGCSYTCGRDGKTCSTPESRYGSLVVTILGVRGAVVMQSTVEREPGGFSHTVPTPTCSGLYLFEGHNAVLIRIHNMRDPGPGGPESWSLLELSTGVAMQAAAPRRPFARATFPNTIGDAVVIRGTPLLVVGWVESSRGLRSRELNGLTVAWHRVFSIVQMDGAIVANIVVQETDVPPEGFALDKDRVLTGFDHGTIVRVDTPRTIELVLSRAEDSEQRHVKLRVEQDKEGRWWLRDG